MFAIHTHMPKMVEWDLEASQPAMQDQKQRYEMPDELLPLWAAVGWRYADKLEQVDCIGFVATKEEADNVFAELRDMTETEKSLED